MKTLFESIYSRFADDTDLFGSVTDMYNTEAPPNAVFPYIVFSLVSDVQDFDSDSVLEDALIQFNIFSDEPSSSEACDIFEYLKGITVEGTGYDFYELTIDNYTTLVLKRDTALLIKIEKVWQYNVTYHCLLNYTGEVAIEKFYGNLYALLSI